VNLSQTNFLEWTQIINAKLDAERKNIEELIKQELKKKQDIEKKR